MSIPRLIAVLVAVGLLCAWCTSVVSLLKGGVHVDREDKSMYMFVSYDSTPLKALKLVGAAAVVAAGFVAMLHGGHRLLGFGTRVIFWSFILASVVWLVLSYDLKDYRSILLDSTSPVIWLMVFGIYAGMQETVWRLLEPLATALAWMTLGFALWSMASIEHYARFRWSSPQVGYAGLLLWFGTYALVRAEGPVGLRTLLRFVPLVVGALSAAFAQARGWLVLYLVSFFLPLLRERWTTHIGSRLPTFIKGLLIGSAALGVLFYILNTSYPTALEGLKDRLGEDTRSEQYRTFFAQVEPEELVLGKGPHATYRFLDDPSYHYFDNQFVWMLFIGGVPIMLGYSLLILAPAFRLLVLSQQGADFAAAASLVLWTLALLGLSTYMNVGFDALNYFMVLLAGYCHARRYGLRSLRG